MMLHTKYQSSRPCGLRQEDFFHVSPYISLCKACDPKIGVIFGPRGIIYTNLLEVYKVMIHTKCQSSRPYGFRQEDFLCFSLYKLM